MRYRIFSNRQANKASIIGLIVLMAMAPAKAQMLTGYDQAPPAVIIPDTSAKQSQKQKYKPSLSAPELSSHNPPNVQPSSLPEPERLSPSNIQAVMTPVIVGQKSAFDVAAEPSGAPVDFDAESLEHDEQTGVITARGNVMMMQAGRILRADEISYNLNTDQVKASGHVVLNEENGDIHYSEYVELRQGLKQGAIEGLRSFMEDGTRFTADQGERKDGTKTIMHDATFTPCRICGEDEFDEYTPAWQLRASKVIHDEELHQIAYENARLEVYGVPVLYTPYFAHPDGTIKRKSGLLAPSAGFKSDLGAFIENRYYWDIAPDRDMTIGLIAMTQEMPLLHGQWRQRWDNASLELAGGVTYSSRTDSIGGVDVPQDEEWRGHVLASGLWDMTDTWRSGVNLQWASDDQYMRQYDFVDDDILETELYAERFSGRNYFVGRLLKFQDIRIRENRVEQPEVLPEVIASFRGEPGGVPVLGGRWGIDTSFLGLQRSGKDQDMNRFSTSGQWYRRFVSDYGLIGFADGQVRADLYNTRDRDVAFPGSGQSSSVTENRFFSNIHMQASYPMVRMFETMQMRIEPVVSLTLAPNIDVNNDIPNEDSQDVQIDAGNLFEPNRFPGLDRIEDRSHVTYGMRTGLHNYTGGRTEVFLGQSMRFDEDNSPFPRGSGLNNQESDIVGQVSSFYKNYKLDYRFQLASRDLTSQRHEVDAYADWKTFYLSSQYLFAKALEGTDIDESREQLKLGAGYYLTPSWRVRVGGTQDLGENPGLRRSYAGLDFFGQCLSWSLVAERNLTEDASGDSDLEVLFRLGLKNLGGFEKSGLKPTSCDASS